MWRQYYPTNKTQLIQNQSLLTKKTIEGLQESIINTKAVRFEAYDLLSVMTSIGACKRGTPSMRECHAGRESVWFIPARYTVRDTSKRYKFYGIFDRTQKGRSLIAQCLTDSFRGNHWINFFGRAPTEEVALQSGKACVIFSSTRCVEILNLESLNITSSFCQLHLNRLDYFFNLKANQSSYPHRFSKHNNKIVKWRKIFLRYVLYTWVKYDFSFTDSTKTVTSQTKLEGSAKVQLL